METKNIITILASIIILTACATIACNKTKLKGTSWRMYEQVQGLDDAPTLTFDRTLHFVDNSNVEIFDINESSGYSASYVNEDGTVDYHPGGKTSDVIKGKYSVSGNKLTINIEGKDKPESYIIRKNYLIYDISEKEYDELPEYQRGYYTYNKL